MNYRHIYHAGNFADIFKHIILTLLILQMTKKNSPIAVLDAFAGTGMYDISSDAAQKTGESNLGIMKLIKCENHLAPIERYLRIVSDCQGMYPGSPHIISKLIRDCDRLIACELHKDDYVELRKNIATANAQIHHLDAYLAIKALWPPRERRGIILLDPPFEIKQEFDKLISALSILKKRSLNGVIMTWYPIKYPDQVNDFYNAYQKIGFSENIVVEFEIMSSIATDKLRKCGVIISNPPNILDDLNIVMNHLSSNVYGSSCYKILSI